MLAEGAAGADWVAVGAEDAAELAGACEAEGAGAGVAATAGRAAGTTFTGALVGTLDGVDVVVLFFRNPNSSIVTQRFTHQCQFGLIVS